MASKNLTKDHVDKDHVDIPKGNLSKCCSNGTTISFFYFLFGQRLFREIASFWIKDEEEEEEVEEREGEQEEKEEAPTKRRYRHNDPPS